ncbi:MULTISPECIES: integrase [unclassified Variovorax]|uniref:integrase n=1 Tax=unclassified Variovorax TaxID=663243 RepID=UPI0025777341|nr:MULTISPECIES: integrase [unclassified Variovorax]MDM0090276.1 integrase [Variovorax sp. J22G40]MDM0148058.1 integrase [Variovorax sp. J2P1-31]
MTGQYPRLRSHSRKRKSGKVVVYYVYDRRPEGESDIALGTDFDEAIAKWREIHEEKPRTIGTIEEAFAQWELDVLPAYTSKETRRGYTKHLRTIRPVFGPATWDQVDLPTIKQYLRQRSGKTQANREMAVLSIVWNWARGEGMTKLPWPAAGMERSKWKNTEKPRKMKVLDPVWEAIRHEGNITLQDCMDLGAATGMRLTDCTTVLLPKGDTLHLEASKTGKEAEWDMSLSATLPDLVQRRRTLGADHLMLLSTPEGRPVELRKLSYQWDKARTRAAVKASIANDDDMVRAIRALYLRDARKRAAQKSGSLEAAAQLLQHDDKRLTERHYGGVRQLKPVA